MLASAESVRRRAYDTDVDPFARVFALGGRDDRRMASSTLLALLLYAAGIANRLSQATALGPFADSVQRAIERVEYRIDFEEPPPPPPKEEPPPPEPEPEKEPPKAVPAPQPAAPPPPAQAGQVLAADPDPDEPLDLTGNTFVQGTGDTYAGGITSSTGTSHTAVRDVRASPSGAPAPAIAPVAMGPQADLSRPAKPLSGSWDHCGFPAEADMEQVNYARATIAVTIAADGRAQSVSVVQDPGYGFGALAKRCALRERFDPARAKNGTAIAATQVITINFRR